MSDSSRFFRASSNHLLCTAGFLLLTCLSLPGQTHGDSAILRGHVRDAQGKTSAGADVRLQQKGSTQIRSTQTSAQGEYDFSGLDDGLYALTVLLNGQIVAEEPSIVIAGKETKTLDLKLRTPSTQSTPQFFDQPQFTVSGVTDTTNLGGHGSDTVVRTRESLAKETVSLGRPEIAAAGTHASATEKSLREALDHDPRSFEANSRLGLLLLQNQRADEAVSYLRRAAEIQPRDADIHHAMGDAAEKLNNPLEAVRQYQRAAELNPSESFLFDWGAELLLHHAAEPAVQVFTKGHSLHPGSSRMLIGLGAAWFARGANDEAVQRLCEASDLNPTDPNAYLFLGKMLRAETRPSQNELEKLRRFAISQPQNADAKYYYAVALWKSRKDPQDPVVTEAQSLLVEAIRLNPRSSAAHLQLGIVQAEKRDDANAISEYHKAIQIDPKLEEAHFRLAQAYRQTGEIEKSKEELRIHQQLAQQSAQEVERERHEIRQFVYTLRDQTGTAH